MSPLVALAISTSLTVSIVALVAYLMVRSAKPTENPLGSPDCDRCGKSTGKPWLWSQPKRPWHCAQCDGEVAFLRFEALLEAQRDPAQP